MSIRDVMMTEESINLAAVPAGIGGFSRTAFEKSSLSVTSSTTSQNYYYVFKYIAPENGIYKISYEGRIVSESNSYSCTLYLYHRNLSSEKAGNYDMNSYQDIYTGKKAEISITLFDTVTPIYPSGTFSKSWTSFTGFIYSNKGQALIAKSQHTNAVMTLELRNIKVTY